MWIPSLGHTVEADTRAAQFGQAVGLMRLDAHALLDFQAHRGGPGLRSEHPDPQGQSADVDLQLRRAFGDRQGIGWRAEERGRSEILHQGDLPFSQPRAGGNQRAADAGEALVEAQAAGEQAVAVSVLRDVVGADTCRPEIARHTVGRIVQVIGRVGAGDRLAGRPRGGVHPDDLP